MKKLARVCKWTLGAIASILAIAMVDEIFIYAWSDSASAQKIARGEFEKVCKREKLACQEFRGPEQVMRRDRAYEFVWKNASNGDEILALTSYLPFGAEAWLVRGETKRAVKQPPQPHISK